MAIKKKSKKKVVGKSSKTKSSRSKSRGTRAKSRVGAMKRVSRPGKKMVQKAPVKKKPGRRP